MGRVVKEKKDRTPKCLCEKCHTTENTYYYQYTEYGMSFMNSWGAIYCENCVRIMETGINQLFYEVEK